MRTPQEFKDLVLGSFIWYFNTNIEHLYESLLRKNEVLECSDFMTFKESKEENIFNPDNFSVTFETYGTDREYYEDGDGTLLIYKVKDLKTNEFVYIQLFVPYINANYMVISRELSPCIDNIQLVYPVERRIVEWEINDIVSPKLVKLDSENGRRFCIKSYVDGETYSDFYDDYETANTVIHRYLTLSEHEFILFDKVLGTDLISVKNKELKYLVSDSFIKEHYQKV